MVSFDPAPLCKVYIRVLIVDLIEKKTCILFWVDLIEKKTCILFWVEKAKCVVYVATIE